MANILCEHEDDCLRIRLASGTTNALTTAVIRDLAQAVDDANREARGAMLCGGEKFFCNGLDLDWALTCSRAEIGEMFHELAGLILAMLESPLPIVGAIRGHAIGGGMAIYLACDYRYAATGRVLIGKPEILLGVPNPYYGDQLLRFVAGDFVASDLIYTGKLVHAEGGRALGLVHETGPKEDIERNGVGASAVLARPRAGCLRGIQAHAARQVLRRLAGADARSYRPPGRDLEQRRGPGPPPCRRGAAQAPAERRLIDRISRHVSDPVPRPTSDNQFCAGFTGIKWDQMGFAGISGIHSG